jgi:hypothetical protein
VSRAFIVSSSQKISRWIGCCSHFSRTSEREGKVSLTNAWLQQKCHSFNLHHGTYFRHHRHFFTSLFVTL